MNAPFTVLEHPEGPHRTFRAVAEALLHFTDVFADG